MPGTRHRRHVGPLAVLASFALLWWFERRRMEGYDDPRQVTLPRVLAMPFTGSH